MKKLSYKEIQSLFEKIKKGDNQAFKELYESSYRAQYFLAYNYINDTYIAEEAVQNMFINFYNHINTIDNNMAIIKWMNTTTINECRRLIRDEKLNRKVDIDNYADSLIDTKPTPEESYKRKDEQNTLNEALNQIEPDIKQVIIYRYVDNLKIKEISKLVNLSTATVNRYIKEGTMKLKKYLDSIENKLYTLVLSPVVFHMFNTVMRSQVSDQQITQSFEELFKDITIATTSTGIGIAGGKVVGKIAKKSIPTAAKIVGGATAAVATTATVVAAVISPSISIELINEPYVLNQSIHITSNDYKNIDSISCYKDDDLIGKLEPENNYTIEIDNNGEYIIAVKDNVGITRKEKVIISNIDYTCPSIEVEKGSNDYIVTISDNGSGINYDTLSIINQDGNNIDYHLNDNVVTFTNSNQTSIITISDNLGNTKQLTLNNNE